MVAKERLDKAVQLHKQGLTHSEICQKLGISSSTLLRLFRPLGVRGVPGGKPTYTDDHMRTAVALYRSGETMNAIGRALGFTGPTIRVMLVKSGALDPSCKLIARYDPELQKEALRLYVAEEMSTHAVAKRLGLKTYTVKEWAAAAGVIRSMSKAASLAIAQGRKRGRSYNHHLWQSEKAGGWVLADSIYEVVRMGQLDKDPQVRSWGLCTHAVKYEHPVTGKTHSYIADIHIVYMDGREVVEEVKPSCFVSSPLNEAKAAAALVYFGSLGIGYRFVTEVDIGTDEIAAYKAQGLQTYNAEDRLAREKAKKKEARQRRLSAETPEMRKQRLEREAALARSYRKARSENQKGG